jgi:predicted membrane protein DUF2157
MPEPASKREAQLRVDRIRAFREELSELEAEGALALSPEQHVQLNAHLDTRLAALAGRFDVDVTPSQKQISWGMRIASTIGGLALCAAVFLFFYRFWGLLAVTTQVVILSGAPLLLVVAAEFTSRRERTLYYTGLLSAVAFAAMVLNLNVLGSIFNMTPSPNAFLAWSVFGLALAYAYGLRLLLAAGLVCASAWVAMWMMALGGYAWMEVLTRPENFLAPAAGLIAAPALIPHRQRYEFPVVYRLIGLLTLFAALLILSLDGNQSYLPMTAKHVGVMYQTLGFVAAGVAIWRGIVHQMPAVVNLSATFFVIHLYVRLAQWWWDLLPKYLFFLLIGLISVGLLTLFKRLRAA